MKISFSFFKKYKILILLLVIAFFLRAVDINNNPKSLYGDELTIVYDSYSLLTTAHDSTGAFLPLTLKNGAGRPGGYVYGSIPFVALFGPTALGVRTLSILSGVGIVFLLYLLGKKLFNNQVGLLAALLTVISPWDISLSRGGFEAHFALFLALLGIVILLYGSTKKHWIAAGVAFGLTFHTYPTYKLVLPIFIALLFWYKKISIKETFGSKMLPGLIIFIILAVLAIFQTFTGGSEDRFFSINAFSQPEVRELLIQNLNIERNSSNITDGLKPIFHNRPLSYSKILFDSYLENFSVNFLFTKGDAQPRHNPATTGEFFYIQMILIFLGVGFLWFYKRIRELIFLIGWICLAPIATTFLLQAHALRNSFMIPPLELLSALGLFFVWQFKSIVIGKLALIIIGLCLILQFGFFAEELYFTSATKFQNFWSYPAKEASALAVKNQSSYRYVVLSDEIPDILYGWGVYSKTDPRLYQPDGLQQISFDGIMFQKYGNVLIGHFEAGQAEQLLKSLPTPSILVANASWKTELIQSSHLEISGDNDIIVLK